MYNHYISRKNDIYKVQEFDHDVTETSI